MTHGKVALGWTTVLKRHQVKSHQNVMFVTFLLYTETTVDDLMRRVDSLTEQTENCLRLSEVKQEIDQIANEFKGLHWCDECYKTFTKEVNLTLHIRAVHLGEKAYQCPECTQAFFSRGKLKKHMHKVHRKKLPIKAPK